MRRFSKFPPLELVKYVSMSVFSECLSRVNPKMHFELKSGPNYGRAVFKLKFDPMLNEFAVCVIF